MERKYKGKKKRDRQKYCFFFLEDNT